ncbi:MAG: ABC transporter permease [Bacteroidales bacterium]|nr:ABC transporter permease [Bacteroidales bacterium]
MEPAWSTVITPNNRLLRLNLREVWQYRDLCMLLVRRAITTQYKQTLLGVLWFVIQPLLTTVIYMVVFGGIAGISTDGLPQPLFYLSGIALWNYFADSLTKNANTFVDNAAIFGKVYFPRIVMPLSIVISHLLRLAIQLGLLLVVYAIYQLWLMPGAIHTNGYLLLLPLLIVMLAGHSLAFSMLFSSLTTKYRDLQVMLTFLVGLWMYATPVIYPLSTITNSRLHTVMMLNPVTSIVEAFRYGMLGVGELSWWGLAYSFGVMVVLLMLALVTFNKVQRNFMDHV